MRIFTNLFPRNDTGSIAVSHCLQVCPKKSFDDLSSSVNSLPSFLSGPYQPIADADTIALILFGRLFKLSVISFPLSTLLETISRFLFFVHLFSATDAPARWIM